LFFVAGRQRFESQADWVIKLIILYFLSFLPALQYSVTADYQNYISIVERSPEKYFITGEYVFYFFVWIIKTFDLHSQMFFVFSALLQSFLILGIFSKLERFGYKAYILFLLLVVSTGMLHNQMNLVRMYVSVYAFLNFVLCRYEKNWSGVFFYGVLGFLSHKTFIISVIFVLIPTRFFVVLGKFSPITFFVSVVFYFFAFDDFFIRVLVQSFVPAYSHYLSSALFSEGSNILSVAYKLYFWPVYFLFFFSFKKFYFSRFDFYILGIWAVFSPLFLTFIESALMVRVYHYLIFFNLFPLYWVLVSYRKSPLFVVVILYVSAPYFLNVLVLNYGAYFYQSILGPICVFPWGMPQC
jgi:hypothetical protein